MSIPAPMPRYDHLTLREVSNLNLDAKERLLRAAAVAVPSARASTGSLPSGRSSTNSLASRGSGRLSVDPSSPHADRHRNAAPQYCSGFISDICDMFFAREKTMQRDANYLATQTEVTEKMRTILIDWLVDVHQKFHLRPETFFLAVDIIDRYLSISRVTRQQLQLVGVTAMLLAAKYEEMWPPEVKDCIHISANTYSRNEILTMERTICATLQYRLTTPTTYPFLERLLQVTEADAVTRNTALFFLEHAAMDYKSLQFLPSQLANASLYLANVVHHKADPWNHTLKYYSKSRAEEFNLCAKSLLEYTTSVTTSKYQAIHRKYSSTKFSEVAQLVLPVQLPIA